MSSILLPSTRIARPEPSVGLQVDQLLRGPVAAWEADGTILPKDIARQHNASGVYGALSPVAAIGKLGRCVEAPERVNMLSEGLYVAGQPEWGVGGYEKTLYAVVEFTCLFGASPYEHLIARAAGISSQGISLGYFPNTKTIRPLISTTGTSGWTASNDLADSRLADHVPWLIGFTWSSAKFLKVFSAPIGAEPVISSRPITPSGYYYPLANYAMFLMGGEYIGSSTGKGGIKLYSARMLDRSLLDSEIVSLAANPQLTFRKTHHRIWFDMGAGGPATYSDSFTESLTAAYSAVDSAIYNSAIASGVTASDGDTGTLTLAESIAAGVTAADAVLSSTTFADAHSAGVTASTALVSIQIVLETLASSVTAGYTQSDSLVGVSGTTYNETHSAGITASFSVVSVQTFVAALSEALTAAESLTSNADYQIALSEALTALDSYTVSDGTTTLTAADLAAIAALIDARIADIAAAIGTRIIEGTLTQDEITRIQLAALAGKTAGIGTATERYLAQDNVTPRITATFDQDSNRTSVTLDGSA